MEQINLPTLQVVQEMLRTIIISLATVHKTDMPLLASLLQAAATHTALQPTTRNLLLDLAQGLDMLGAKPQQ